MFSLSRNRFKKPTFNILNMINELQNFLTLRLFFLSLKKNNNEVSFLNLKKIFFLNNLKNSTEENLFKSFYSLRLMKMV